VATITYWFPETLVGFLNVGQVSESI